MFLKHIEISNFRQKRHDSPTSLFFKSDLRNCSNFVYISAFPV